MVCTPAVPGRHEKASSVPIGYRVLIRVIEILGKSLRTERWLYTECLPFKAVPFSLRIYIRMIDIGREQVNAKAFLDLSTSY
jgi:hypothetical protein